MGRSSGLGRMKEIDFLKAMLQDLENNIKIIESRIKKLSREVDEEEITTKYARTDLINKNSNLDY